MYHICHQCLQGRMCQSDNENSILRVVLPRTLPEQCELTFRRYSSKTVVCFLPVAALHLRTKFEPPQI